MTNDNVLAGITCPHCNSEDMFDIVATAKFLHVTDDGCTEFEGMDWDSESDITCKSCGHNGIIEDFQVEDEGPAEGEGVVIQMGSMADLFK